MTDATEADVVVVGLGLIGSGALRSLAAAGTACVGIGPGEPPVFAEHSGAFASHYDSGRITRRLDARLEWALLAARSIAGYAALEAESGIAFHTPAGAVLSELDQDRIASTRANAEQMGVPIDVVAAKARESVSMRSPSGFRMRFPKGSTLLIEPPPAGHVDPRRMLAANLEAARRAGAVVIDAEVGTIERDGGAWLVRTRTGREVKAAMVVLAAGPHTDELLGDWVEAGAAPVLEARGETIVLATLDDAEQSRLRAFPSVLARLRHPIYEDLYVVPPTTYPDGTVRLKLGATLREYRHLRTAEAKRAWMRGTEHEAELPELRALLEGLVEDIRATSWEAKPCLITETPSDLPYVDHLAPGLVIAAGGNGYAAKSANAIGALAGRLVVDGEWRDDELAASSFALSRRPARD